MKVESVTHRIFLIDVKRDLDEGTKSQRIC